MRDDSFSSIGVWTIETIDLQKKVCKTLIMFVGRGTRFGRAQQRYLKDGESNHMLVV
jgi:hypothetical protein